MLLGAPGIATRSKDATKGLRPNTGHGFPVSQRRPGTFPSDEDSVPGGNMVSSPRRPVAKRAIGRIKLLGAPGIATRNPGVATRSKKLLVAS